MSKNEGFLGSFLSKGLRTNQLELNTDEKTLRPIARLKEPRDLFALPKNKDHEFALQAPRWPIECQVLEERVIHIIDTHVRPEPYNTPGGLKPRPVGEENGEVVFNYNPISPVNYDKPKAKFRESSDSDISSSESRNSSPDRGTVHDAPLKAEGRTSFTKLISSLNQRSSSNSNDDEEVCEDTEDVVVSPDNGSVTTPLISESNSIDSTNNINDNQTSITSTDASEGMTTQTSDEIDDIWVNNSTEYPPGTPIFTRMPVSPLKMDSQQLIELSNLNKTSTESLVLNANAATGGGDKKDEVIGDKKEGTELVTEPGKKVITKLETELVIRSITSTVTSTAGGGNDTMTTTDSDRNKPNEKDVELRVKTPILNDDVLKLYNDIISVTESNKSEPQNERKTTKIESKPDKESKQDSHVCNERQTKMYLDLNVEEDAYKNARNMFFARNSQDNTKLNTDSSSSMSQFSRSNINGSKTLTNCHPCTDENYDGLEFESRFESGNLAKAVRITKSYYELYLRPDLYTNRSKQWFYFRVRKTKKDILYRFSIVNLVKSDSLYNEGMRPVMYSTMRARQLREGWRRCGENVCYYRNEDENTTGEEDDDSTYTLTFNIEFPNDDDTVYLAHSYPYTYSDLQDYLMGLQKHPVKSKFCKLRILCRTLAGNNVYYLTVTSPPRGAEEGKSKKSIVISARVHPSETPASWMMKGLMDYITGDTWIARRLRQKFVFKLIPMLNPDGVIVGNTRNSLTGKDLNRQYRTVIRETYPSIWYTKALVKRLIDECGVAMYCDMHAHSRKQNIFLYGCENKRNPEKKLTEQVFPLMMHKNASDTFSFEGCKFKVQRNKEGTGRIVVWMLGITNSYTIEASFGGSSLGGRRGTHFNTIDYENIGRTFCETLLDYCDDHPNKERLRLKIIERLMKEGSSADEPLNIRLSDYSSDEGHASSDSDSEKKSSIKTSDLYELSPETSPSSAIANVRDKRRLLFRRMRKIMHELDRIYFQPLFQKKYQHLLKCKQTKQKSLRNKLRESKTESTIITPSKNRAKANDDQNQLRNENQAQNQNADILNQNQSKVQNQNKNQISNQNSKVRNSNLAENSKTDNSNQALNHNTNAQNQNKTIYQILNHNQNLNQIPIQSISNLSQYQIEEKDSNVTIQASTSKVSKPKAQKVDTVNQNRRIKVSRNLRLFLETRNILIVRKLRKRPKLVHKGTRKGSRVKDGTDMPTTDPNSDILFSTDDELCSNRSNSNSMRLMLMQSDLQRHYIKEIGGSSFFLNHMPPEVIITTPSTTSKFEIISPNSIKNYPQLREGSGLLSMRRTSSWHNLHCTESVRKTKLQNQYQNPQDFSKDDLQLKLPPKTKYWPGVAPESHKWMKSSLPPSFGIPQTTVTNLFSIQSEVKTGNFASTSSHNSAEWDNQEAFFKACSDKILNVNYFSNLMTSSTTSAARASHPPRDKSSRSSFMPDINLEERTLRIFKQVTKFSAEQSENMSSSFHTKSRGLRKKKQRSPPDTTNQILSHLRTLSKAGKSRSNITLHRLKSGSTPTHSNPIHVRRSNNQLQQQHGPPSNWTDTSKFKASGIVVRSASMRRCKLHPDNKLLLQQTVPTATVVAMVPKTRLAAHSQLAENPSGRQIPHSVKRKFKAPKNTTIRSLTLVKPGGDADPTTFAQAAPTTKKSATVAGERGQVKLKKIRDVPQ